VLEDGQRPDGVVARFEEIEHGLARIPIEPAPDLLPPRLSLVVRPIPHHALPIHGLRDRRATISDEDCGVSHTISKAQSESLQKFSICCLDPSSHNMCIEAKAFVGYSGAAVPLSNFDESSRRQSKRSIRDDIPPHAKRLRKTPVEGPEAEAVFGDFGEKARWEDMPHGVELGEEGPGDHLPFAKQPRIHELLGAGLLELGDVEGLVLHQELVVDQLGGDEDPLQLENLPGPRILELLGEHLVAFGGGVDVPTLDLRVSGTAGIAREPHPDLYTRNCRANCGP
jgi:hypothetical protein